ncbi:ABC transporter ATP-binding protein [Clostridium sp. E02]|uniref:ABC transporter ATP-binding protein n=1 Tax=Clostridium sp. E02 TaxID=2487134 RepID=UPI000F53759A|nr:ABC transporter ATP-binding protein [Clostridium sp. E02]
MKILEAINLKKHYAVGGCLVKAVDDVSFSVEKSEFIVIVGSSGSGKTTLLNLLGGLDTADSGQVIIQGQSLSDIDDEARTIFRRKNIGFIFQNYNLLQSLNVYKNITIPVRLDGIKPDEKYILEIIRKLGLEEKMNVRPNQLSGGQQQRVAIARALAAKPSIILADEPTGNLDSKTSLEVLELMQTTLKELNQTILMITHNETIAKMADRVIYIADGKIAGGKQNE